MKFIEDMSVKEREKYFEERRKLREEQQLREMQNKELKDARYRSEQFVISKINDVIHNHIETRREFIVKRQRTVDGLYVEVQMVDNHIQCNPPSMQEAIELITNIDNIKCGRVLVLVNSKTGKIEKLLNHNEIIKKWEDYRRVLESKYAFFRTKDHRKMVDDFTATHDKQIRNQQVLINELNAKLFFDLYFDKYLVTKDNNFEPFVRTFNSHLFEGVSVNLNFKQNVTNESPDTYAISKKSSINKGSINLSAMEEMYDKKYRPAIHYKFSDYDYTFFENSIINTSGEMNQIEESNVFMSESVKNNLQVLIDYKLRKIE
jgi:hypothetical protein